MVPIVWCEPVNWFKITLLPTLALLARTMASGRRRDPADLNTGTYCVIFLLSL
jgi:hypothetical protein